MRNGRVSLAGARMGGRHDQDVSLGGGFDPVIGVLDAKRKKLIVGQRRARTWKHRSGELLEVIKKPLHQRKFIAARLSVI